MNQYLHRKLAAAIHESWQGRCGKKTREWWKATVERLTRRESEGKTQRVQRCWCLADSGLPNWCLCEAGFAKKPEDMHTHIDSLMWTAKSSTVDSMEMMCSWSSEFLFMTRMVAASISMKKTAMATGSSTGTKSRENGAVSVALGKKRKRERNREKKTVLCILVCVYVYLRVCMYIMYNVCIHIY